MKSYQFDIELFQGYMCPGIPVTEDLTIEVEFSDEEVAKIRQLVKDYTGDKEAGLMPILQDDAPELYERVSKAAFREIYDFYLLDGLRNDGFSLDEEDQRRNFKKDLESGEFNPEEYIEDSEWYDEVPTDEDELFNLGQFFFEITRYRLSDWTGLAEHQIIVAHQRIVISTFRKVIDYELLPIMFL